MVMQDNLARRDLESILIGLLMFKFDRTTRPSLESDVHH